MDKSKSKVTLRKTLKMMDGLVEYMCSAYTITHTHNDPIHDRTAAEMETFVRNSGKMLQRMILTIERAA